MDYIINEIIKDRNQSYAREQAKFLGDVNEKENILSELLDYCVVKKPEPIKEDWEDRVSTPYVNVLYFKQGFFATDFQNKKET